MGRAQEIQKSLLFEDFVEEDYDGEVRICKEKLKSSSDQCLAPSRTFSPKFCPKFCLVRPWFC